MSELSPNFLEARGTILGYGRRPLSTLPFDLDFPRQSFTALVGPNGAGKSTFLKALLGEAPPRAGEIFLGAARRPVGQLPPRELAKLVAYVPQEHLFSPDLRLIDFLKLSFLKTAGIFGRLPDDHAANLESSLAEFGLTPLRERPLGNLSPGERQRVFLARAVLQRAEILVLDEPTNHLDPGAVRKFWANLARARRAAHFEILVSTHDLAFVEKYCDWVCAFFDGRPMFSGPREQYVREEIAERLFGA